MAGPKLWNKLPLDIRQSSPVTVFKTKLKTYLFEDAFDLQFLSLACAELVLDLLFINDVVFTVIKSYSIVKSHGQLVKYGTLYTVKID